jgi:Ankyrin repeats (3 copies)
MDVDMDMSEQFDTQSGEGVLDEMDLEEAGQNLLTWAHGQNLLNSEQAEAAMDGSSLENGVLDDDNSLLCGLYEEPWLNQGEGLSNSTAFSDLEMLFTDDDELGGQLADTGGSSARTNLRVAGARTNLRVAGARTNLRAVHLRMGARTLFVCIRDNDCRGLTRYLGLVREGLRPSHNDWAVHYAVFLNRREVLFMLLAYGGYHASAKDIKGSTPLHYACTNGFFNCVYCLVCYGADIEATDSNGRTPVFGVASTQRDRRIWNTQYRGNESPPENDLVLSLKVLLHVGVKLDTEDRWRCTACSVANLYTAAGRLLLHVSLMGLGAILFQDIRTFNVETLNEYYNGEDAIVPYNRASPIEDDFFTASDDPP